jgi:hypothetical protein
MWCYIHIEEHQREGVLHFPLTTAPHAHMQITLQRVRVTSQIGSEALKQVITGSILNNHNYPVILH